MKKPSVKEKITNILPYLSLSEIAQKYFGKSRHWLYHKLNEDIINGVQYRLNEQEVEVLINALNDIKDELSSSVRHLNQVKQKCQKKNGRYYTSCNPFNHLLFFEWLNEIPNYAELRFLEPFAGDNSIIKFIQEIDDSIVHWTCFDKHPTSQNRGFKIIKRDTIKNFPKGFDVVVTNPPYLAKNSAKKKHIDFPETNYDDLYKLCLDRILENSDYSAVIIPESFITADLFHERLYGVISLNTKIFTDTNCPVCLALFVPEKATQDFKVYIGEKYVGMFNELKTHNLSKYNTAFQWIFNAPNGSIGVKCIDSLEGADIRFVRGDSIPAEKIKVSSRAFTRISGLPEGINPDEFIQKCNAVLADYRENTMDIFLTSFKGLHKGGRYRRRIDFNTIKWVLNKALLK